MNCLKKGVVHYCERDAAGQEEPGEQVVQHLDLHRGYLRKIRNVLKTAEVAL